MADNEDLSVDDFSYRQNRSIEQESFISDTVDNGLTLGIGSKSYVVFPPSDLVEHSQSHHDLGTGFNNEYADLENYCHNQSAKVKSCDSSSSSDEPDEETAEGHNSTDAFASSGSGKNVKVRSEDLDREVPAQRMRYIVPNSYNEDRLDTGPICHLMAMSDRNYDIGPNRFKSTYLGPMLQSMANSGSPRELMNEELGQDSPHAQVRGETHDGGCARFVKETEKSSDRFEIKTISYAVYSTYQARFESYINWPHEKPSVEEMANAGFFHVLGYTDAPDLVQCYKCGNTLEKFTQADDPEEEHDKHFPGCSVTRWE